ncbi:MAG TPA: VOC family protein [Candidatus Saccharimonadales bacterium]
MSKKLLVNLPVKNLASSIEFFTQLGFRFNPHFTDETAACIIISDSVFVMLLVDDRFSEFTPKQIADSRQVTEAILTVAVDEKAEVDSLVKLALESGATEYREPEDHDFMYTWGFQDLDGHLWEVVWMNPDFQPDEHPDVEF